MTATARMLPCALTCARPEGIPLLWPVDRNLRNPLSSSSTEGRIVHKPSLSLQPFHISRRSALPWRRRAISSNLPVLSKLRHECERMKKASPWQMRKTRDVIGVGCCCCRRLSAGETEHLASDWPLPFSSGFMCSGLDLVLPTDSLTHFHGGPLLINVIMPALQLPLSRRLLLGGSAACIMLPVRSFVPWQPMQSSPQTDTESPTGQTFSSPAH